MTAAQLTLELEDQAPAELARRFDLAPAVAVAGSLRTLASTLGAPLATVDQWRRRGVSWTRADEIAVALGRHPAELWPAWWRT